MSDQNQQTVREGYAAFSSGDLETLMGLMTDDAVHHVPGSSEIAGAHKGKESIVALYGKLFELSGGTMQVELEDVLTDGANRCIAIHRGTLVKDGETVGQREALLFTFHDGKIVEIQDFFGDIAFNDQLWS